MLVSKYWKQVHFWDSFIFTCGAVSSIFCVCNERKVVLQYRRRVKTCFPMLHTVMSPIFPFCLLPLTTTTSRHQTDMFWCKRLILIGFRFDLNLPDICLNITRLPQTILGAFPILWLALQQDHQRWRYITVDFGNINGYKWPHGMIWTNGFKRTTKT